METVFSPDIDLILHTCTGSRILLLLCLLPSYNSYLAVPQLVDTACHQDDHNKDYNVRNDVRRKVNCMREVGRHVVMNDGG